ncbi:hypothetical protein, partial [Tepidimonas sp.]|uniref:hypothetical protein n=1 Tax=Tepidimonas sp. TaxID=2002775 RepID=UPI0039187C4F
MRQAIQDAAVAYYTEKVSSNPKSRFDSDEFETAINAVLGGTKGKPALGEVNGAVTVLPENLTAREVEDAFGRMNEQDWANMSVHKTPPRYGDGSPVSAFDLEKEANLRPIGGNQYLVVMGDGTYLTTGKPLANGRMQPYVLALDDKNVRQVLGRPRRMSDSERAIGAMFGGTP